MIHLNLIKYLFISLSVAVVFIGNLINFLEERLPIILVQSFRYGKFAYDGKNKFKLVEVPKKWFKHFYAFASVYSFYALYLAVDVYLYNGKLPQMFYSYLDLFVGSNRSTSVDPVCILAGLTLMSLQCVRRFYETWFVSVFSPGKMNLLQYLIGFFHYWGAITVILAEAKGFHTSRTDSIDIRFSSGTLLSLLGVPLFLVAWYHQFQCATILANLRKNAQGTVVTSAHKIPRGGQFEHLSSPHLTCEIVLYLALAFVLRESSTFPYVFLWVLSNQAEVALLSHWWYKKTFKNYPQQRKALIPGVL